MHAALLLSGRNTLHPVHAALIFELGVHALPLDDGDDFLQAADRGLRRGEHFDLPAPGFGVAVVHAEHLVGEQGGLVAAGTGADFKDDVLLVVGILGQQQDLEILFGLGEAGFECRQFFLGVGAHVSVFLVGQ
jgi:hypothetical protein